MGDMIMLYMALAEGPSEVAVSEITSHSRTNAYVIERFLPVKFSLGGGRPATISVTGIGLRAGPVTGWSIYRAAARPIREEAELR
jgi:RNA 3'-terminal phosphate cyclase